MEEQLKPCPFCGNEKPSISCGEFYDYDGGDRFFAYRASIFCEGCGCTLEVQNEFPKEYVSSERMFDFAIRAWNTRAERTCEMIDRCEYEDADGFLWQDCWQCTACGAMVNGVLPEPGTMLVPKLCPNCGAKVVD